MAIEGADRSKLVVIGDGVDSVSLIQSLRKKIRPQLEIREVSITGEKPEEKEDKPTPKLFSGQG